MAENKTILIACPLLPNLRFFGTLKNFFQKKIHSRGKPSKHYTSRVIYIPFYSQKSPIFGTKSPKCRRYGNTILYRRHYKKGKAKSEK